MSVFNTHRLSLEEVWFVREHPFDIKAVRVKKTLTELEELQKRIDVLEKRLSVETDSLRQRMTKAGEKVENKTPAPRFRIGRKA